MHGARKAAGWRADGGADGAGHQGRGDRELDLQRYKTPVIENLGATLHQLDAIDFSDDEVRKLDGFPLLRRLETLLVNNRVCRTGEGLTRLCLV